MQFPQDHDTMLFAEYVARLFLFRNQLHKALGLDGDAEPTMSIHAARAVAFFMTRLKDSAIDCTHEDWRRVLSDPEEKFAVACSEYAAQVRQDLTENRN
jgi:hypothetical protein